ncbi:ethanolamine utilization protein EutN [bacterium]|nr:ethanolamine utilization protein EutN [bacterium]
MKLGRIIGNLVTTHTLPAYERRKLMMVQPLDTQRQAQGVPIMAIDYVGAGEGDIVLFSAAPGLAGVVFGIEKAPVNELIMGIVDRVDVGK